jgi:hypothetical protein
MWPWPNDLFPPDALRSADTTAGGSKNWRQVQLLRAGFDPAQAAKIAAEPAIDLHALIELVERGCPPELAARILAPFDHERREC